MFIIYILDHCFFFSKNISLPPLPMHACLTLSSPNRLCFLFVCRVFGSDIYCVAVATAGILKIRPLTALTSLASCSSSRLLSPVPVFLIQVFCLSSLLTVCSYLLTSGRLPSVQTFVCFPLNFHNPFSLPTSPFLAVFLPPSVSVCFFFRLSFLSVSSCFHLLSILDSVPLSTTYCCPLLSTYPCPL